MHPALSVIFFTSLSGAGYGLLAWAALATLAGQSPARPLLVAVALALLLATLGLASSFLHLGKPMRAWRAFSQWRTSWLSREGVMAALTYLPALGLAALLLPGMLDADATGSVPALNAIGTAVCIVLLVVALLTVYCTAMIYASLKPIPAWRHRLVVPAYLLFALLTGGLLLAAILAISGFGNDGLVVIVTVVLAIALATIKLKYWRDIDTATLPATRGDAVGLPGREVSVFERPHTEANYLTREMAFVVARRHASRLRWLAAGLFAIVPLLCMLPVALLVHVDATPWFVTAALAALAGAFVERWLFFAEARHIVTLYY